MLVEKGKLFMTAFQKDKLNPDFNGGDFDAKIVPEGFALAAIFWLFTSDPNSKLLIKQKLKWNPGSSPEPAMQL